MIIDNAGVGPNINPSDSPCGGDIVFNLNPPGNMSSVGILDVDDALEGEQKPVKVLVSSCLASDKSCRDWNRLTLTPFFPSSISVDYGCKW